MTRSLCCFGYTREVTPYLNAVKKKLMGYNV